jgi:predicted ATPase/class 3 adenylate cyclase
VGHRGEALSPGREVAGYRVLGPIGRGGISSVHLVEHNALGRRSAMKLLLVESDEARARLLQEGRALARLSHPGIVTVLDVVEVDGMSALVLEYVEGPDLQRWLADHRPTEEAALALFRAITEAVLYAHEHGVVHRDLKPANILLADSASPFPRPKVADFGIAKALSDPKRGLETRAGAIFGTLAYMPPEQLRDAKTAGPRADLWALGCILYELVAGRPAFEGASIVDAYEAASTRAYAPLDSSVHATIRSLVHDLLQPDPAERPESAGDVLARLGGSTPSGTARRATERAPTGLVTFLFSDIEGSTRRWDSHPDTMKEDLAEHDRLLHAAVAEHRGWVFKTVGDAFCVAFQDAADAVSAAIAAERSIGAAAWGPPGPLQVRMALHRGTTDERDGDYFGAAVNRVARILGAAHGGQVLLSKAVKEALPEGAYELESRGERRLKDLSGPETLYELRAPGLRTGFPPLRTLDARPHNLPVAPNAFFGRDGVLRDARKALEGTRLLALSGPGGSGKTRLALEIAGQAIDRFEDGVWFVDLSPILDPGFVPSAVASALGIRTSAEVAIVEAIVEHLAPKQLLLVLDNFEQVVAAAPFVADLLRRAPRLVVLVTSRVWLHLHGERDFPVPPMDVPAAGATLPAIEASESVRFLCERVRAVRASASFGPEEIRAAGEICRLVDGLPLALELAAARSRLLSLRAIEENVRTRSIRFLTTGSRDAPQRQRTLLATIAWSYDLLPADEQLAFERLSTFLGGFDVEGAEALIGSADTLDVLQHLCDQSLLRVESDRDSPRFDLLITLREFGAARLAERGETALADARHAAHFEAWAVARSASLALPEPRAIRRVEEDLENFRKAVRWLAANDPAGLARLVIALRMYFMHAGARQEGLEWCRTAVALASGLEPGLRCDLLHAAGELAYSAGDLDLARRWQERALQMAEVADDPVRLFDSLHALQWVVMYQGDRDQGRELSARASSTVARLADPVRTGRALAHLGWIAFEDGRPTEAVRLFEEAVDHLAIEGGYFYARTLNALGESYRSTGEFARARAAYERALDRCTALELRNQQCIVLFNLALTLTAIGEYRRSAQLHLEAARLRAAGGLLQNTILELYAGAELLAHLGRSEAKRVLAAAEAILTRTGTALPFTDAEDRLRALRTTEHLLGAGLDESGRALTLEQALAESRALLTRIAEAS